MAQDEQPVEPEIDSSSELDLVLFYSSQAANSEIEADVIRGLLESNGIPTVVSTSPYPNLGSEVRVPKGKLEEAQRLVAEAQAAGPQAASEAEASSEDQ